MARSARAQEEIRRFLDIGAVQVAELDLDGDEAVLRPGPGSPPVTHGEVFALVRQRGHPVGTLLARVPEGADAKAVLAERAKTVLAERAEAVPPERPEAIPPERAETGLSERAEAVPPERAEVVPPERAKTGLSERAEAVPAKRAEAIPPERANTGLPERAEAVPPERAKTGLPERAEVVPPERAKTGLPERAEVVPPERAKTGLPERAEVVPPERAEAVPPERPETAPAYRPEAMLAERAEAVGAARTEAVPTGRTEAVPTARAQAVPAARARAAACAPPYASVVVATRERAGQLARALDSLLAQDHPRFEIVVVDNAPVTSETRELVERKYGERVRYVREPVPGLAVAHNTGLAAAHGDVVAFTDDDVVADPRWLTELTTPFAADPGLGCSTGLILPARLTTPAQVLLESHGGFAKGFTPRTYDPARPPGDEPLFPFTAGRFGSGANMAFRTAVLRAVGGFDPATGAGTAARGGDDLYGFVRVLAEGHRLRYTPSALVWHHHRETWRDLQTQAYGYGAGLTAYLTAVLVNRPALLPAFLAKLPRGLAHARALTAVRATEGGGTPGDHDTRTHPWPRRLSRLQRRGMVYGPVGYLRARRALRARGEGAG